MMKRQKTAATRTTDERPKVEDGRSKVLEHARASAAALGGLGGVAVGIKELIVNGDSASFTPVWANISTSTVGLLVCALLASAAALVSRFASAAPNMVDLMTRSPADRKAWAPLAAESQAWREFVGDLVPTAAVGASFGFAIIALTAQFTDLKSPWAALGILMFLLPFGCAAFFLGRRREELLSRIADWDRSST